MHHKPLNPETSVISILPPLSSNCPTYRIVENFHWVQIFVMFMDLLPRELKPRENELRWKLMMSLMMMKLMMCVHRVPMWTRWFSTVCRLNGCYKEESAFCCTKYQWNVRDGPKMLHQLVGVWSEHPAFCENKNPENFFRRVGTLFQENMHQRKFLAIQYLARNYAQPPSE